MAQVEPTTIIDEPIPALIRRGRPVKEETVETALTGLQKEIFLDRYSLRDEDGIQTEQYPEQMWQRVAKGLAKAEQTPELQKIWEEKFFETMRDFKFVPNGRILAGAGTGYQVTLYNCYVIPSPKDSRGGIMDNIKTTVEIQSRGGGVGVNLSSLRPRGARVKKVNGTSSGPINWAALYSTANYDVIQQGGSRRGALMLMLNDWHPDVEEFIEVKKDLSRLPGANLSLCVSDEFMEAMKADRDWDLAFPDTTDSDYDIFWDGDIDKWRSMGKKVVVYKTIKARDIWDKIAKAAWQSAEPGVVFMDRYNKLSNTWYFEKIICTNPCAEQGLGAWAVCNLGTMNLVPYVKDGVFDYGSFSEDVGIAVRFLDNAVDVNYYFLDENKKSQMEIRRIGLGLMGLADAHILLEVKYGTEQSVELTERIYQTMRDAAYRASVDCAKEKGSFLKFEADKYLQGEFIQRLPDDIKHGIASYGIRNAVVLTQAPTGTISLLAGVSSGLEPVFEFVHRRRDRTGEHIVEHSLLKKWKDEHPSEEAPAYFISASQLTPEEHVAVQATAQKYIDSSISKTVNAPESYTVEDVKKLYELAYDSGCKGITFYRDGSREGVLTKIEKKEAVGNGHAAKMGARAAELQARPTKVEGATYRIETPLGTAFITVNHDADRDPFEVFINVGRAGSEVAAMAEAIGRLISTTLRFGNHLPAKERAREIVEQLHGIGGANAIGFGANRVRSLPDAVAKAIAMHFEIEDQNAKVKSQNEGVAAFVEAKSMKRDLCPSCGAAALVLEEGCSKCYGCGFSKC